MAKHHLNSKLFSEHEYLDSSAHASPQAAHLIEKFLSLYIKNDLSKDFLSALLN